MSVKFEPRLSYSTRRHPGLIGVSLDNVSPRGEFVMRQRALG
jgi:hypothetical protein